MRRKRYLTLLLNLALFIFAGAAYAQFENGSLVGTVADTTGAVVPGAKVVVTNTETGVVLTRTTDSVGEFQFPSLRVGVYRVEASMAGFQNALANQVHMSVATTQRVNLVLKPGSSNETVTVEANELGLVTETSQRGQVITNEQIEAFPLSTLDYSDLVTLSTGAITSPLGTDDNSSSLVREGSFNINGQRSMFNNFLLDGMDNNAQGVSNQGFSNQIIQPSQNSISQFQVVTNNQSAEYGRSAGGTINVAFKSGSNDLHGEVYEYFRNTNLNANGYFVSPTGKPTLIRNQFGANLGGPILRNKFFYFVDYEGVRQIRSHVNRSNVFKLSDRQLILNPDVPGQPPNTTKVNNPYTGAQYPGDQPLPRSALSPIALAILDSFPLPNTPGVPANVATNNYTALQRFLDDADKYDLRLDAQWTPRTSSFLRLSQSKEYAVDGPSLPEPLDGAVNGKQRIINQQVALGLTRQIGAAQLLEFRLGASYTKGGKYTAAIGDTRTFGIPGTPTDPRIYGGLVSQVISGYTTFGRQATNPQWQYPFLLDPKISYSWLKGKHSLKTGYEFQYLQEIVADTNPLFGRMTYAGKFSGSVIGDFLFGAPSKIELTNFYVAHIRANSHYAYFQDDWKVLPKLTLNLGMRYEYGGRFRDKDNSLTNFDPATTPKTLTMLKAHSGSAYDETLIDPDMNDFAPRIGFAYSATPKTVIHAGYGVSFIHFSRNAESETLSINGPQVVVSNLSQVPKKAKSGTGTPTANFYSIDQGFPNGFTSEANYDLAKSTITYVPRNYRDPYVQSYYVDVQQSVGRNQIVDIAYVGNHSVKLGEVGNFNQANPAWGRVNGPNSDYIRPYSNLANIIYAFNGAMENYNALQARYEQRHRWGLTVLNSFTWSRTFDTASGNLGYKYGHSPTPQNLYNLSADYGPSEFDRPLVNVTSIVYTPPVGRGRTFLSHDSYVVDALLGGWQISAINTARSGPTITPTYSPTAINQVSGITAAYGGANYYRPWRVPGTKVQRLHVRNNPTIAFCNTPQSSPTTGIGCQAFLTSTAPAGVDSPFGDSPNGLYRADPFNSLDLALNKTFALPVENFKVQFRGQFYNVLNKTNFQPPGTTCCSTSFGQITDTFGPGRIGQVALKVLF